MHCDTSSTWDPIGTFISANTLFLGFGQMREAQRDNLQCLIRLGILWLLGTTSSFRQAKTFLRRGMQMAGNNIFDKAWMWVLRKTTWKWQMPLVLQSARLAPLPTSLLTRRTRTKWCASFQMEATFFIQHQQHRCRKSILRHAVRQPTTPSYWKCSTWTNG